MTPIKELIYLIIFILLTLFTTGDEQKDMFYHDIEQIKNPNHPLVLVNKFHRLDKDYIPKDLEKIKLDYANDHKYLRHPARIAFEELSQDAKKLGYKIIAVSAFRSYRYQDDLYNYYVREKGLEYADKASARPGHSEHQTGLSVDVMGDNEDYDLFEQSSEFNWMKENAHKYGFIMRYPKGKEYITGFKYEPWHYRYVGIEPATEIYKKNITLEEYLRTK